MIDSTGSGPPSARAHAARREGASTWPSRWKLRLGLGLILAARLIMGCAYSALTPLGEAPDEADHYAYAAYIVAEEGLPEGAWMTQAKHPPLYHAVAAGVIAAADVEPDFTFLRANPDGGVTSAAQAPNLFVHTKLESWPWQGGALAMHLGRLVSVLAGLVLTAATFLLGRRIWPAGGNAAPLAAAAFTAFLPESLFIGGAMSNDLLAAMWSALALWMAASRGLGAALAAGLFLGLGVLTKASTGFLAPVLAAVLLARSWPNPLKELFGLRALGHVSMAGAAALAVAAPWLWRNWRLYGDPWGWPLVLATIDRRQGSLTAADLWELARGWFLSFWGKFGGAGHIALPAASYVFWGALIAAAAVGWIMVRRSAQRCGRPEAWIILLGGPAAAVLAILIYSRVALGTDQGRLLFPGLAPVALLLAGGLGGWLPERSHKWLPLAVAGSMVAMAVWALAAGIIAPFSPPAAPSGAELAAATRLGQIFSDESKTPAQRIELAAVRWGEESNGGVTLTLYWRAPGPLRDDLRAVIRLTDAGGNLLWEWKRSPAAGRFSTDRWPPDRPVADVYRVPAAALMAASRIEIGVRPFPEGDWWTPASGAEQLLALPKPAEHP